MKFFKPILLAVFMLVIATSCDKEFLEKTPYDAIAEDKFYNSAARAQMAVNAAYRSLVSIHSNEGYDMMHLAPTDDVDLAPSLQGALLNSFTISADYFVLENAYTALYEGVNRANTAIDKIAAIEMDQTLKARLIGEAKFLRALYYFDLSKLWGDVPLITTTLKTPDEALVAKSPKDKIQAQIIQDLESAIAVLPPVYGDSDVGRATLGAAQALLGKVYLYNSDFNKAKEFLQKVIASNRYKLVNDFATVVNRNNPNNSESIFEIQYAQGIVTSSKDGRFLPRGHFGSGYYLVTQDMVGVFETNDSRLSYSIFRDGDSFAPSIDPKEATFRKEWSLTGYSIKKGILPIQSPTITETNWPIIRYADVLLMYAEAANELGHLDDARLALNLVRRRPSVNLPDRTVAETSNKQALFEAIVHERRVELAFEFHRYHDLLRWNLADKYLGKLGYTSKYRYFPLPQVEIDTNPALVQTSGW